MSHIAAKSKQSNQKRFPDHLMRESSVLILHPEQEGI